MNDELDETLDELEQEVLDELNTPHRPYRTITSYTCSLTIPDDETTDVIIKTKSAGLCYATSPEDALKQMKCDQQYSQQGYASHILRYVAENLPEVDLESADFIVSVGRGIEKEENKSIAFNLAQALGAEVSASRPVVDAGWLPSSRQVGSSGSTISPKLYFSLVALSLLFALKSFSIL